jgi:hypothetical protein
LFIKPLGLFKTCWILGVVIFNVGCLFLGPGECGY